MKAPPTVACYCVFFIPEFDLLHPCAPNLQNSCSPLVFAPSSEVSTHDTGEENKKPFFEYYPMENILS